MALPTSVSKDGTLTYGPVTGLVFQMDEVSGSSPLSLTLRSGLLPLHGAEFSSIATGGKHTPAGSSQSILSVSSLNFDDTTFEFSFDAQYMNVNWFGFTGSDEYTFTPEGLAAIFALYQSRARLCNVSIGAFGRIGLVREVKVKPNRGYQVDPFAAGNAQTTPGTNVDVSVKFEWASLGLPGAVGAVAISPLDASGGLADLSAGLSSALADANGLDGDFFSQLSDAVGNVQAGISQLRGDLAKVGDLASAPAALANKIAATARSVGNLLNDTRNILADTAAAYRIAGQSLSALLNGNRTCANVGASVNDGMGQIIAILDAIENRKKTMFGVRPGQSLSDIARDKLGNADRWPEIADLNEIHGQFVPDATYAIELPAKGG